MLAAGLEPKIVIAGAGIAGSILAAPLHRRYGPRVMCFERAFASEQDDIGTGLNIGPNGVKTLRAFSPQTARALEREGLPWRAWTIALVNGHCLLDLRIASIADNDGLRMRWSDLYRTLRRPAAEAIRFGHDVVAARYAAGAERGPLVVDVLDRTTGTTRRLEGIELLIAADGRFSRLRSMVVGEKVVRQLGVANFRLLVPDDPPSGIDDYVQYYEGPNRLLAYRVPGAAVYLTGTFPLSASHGDEYRREASELRALFAGQDGGVCGPCAYLLDAMEQFQGAIHWSRFHDEPAAFRDQGGHILLLGDAAHPIVPTLGQGATLAIEDACVAADELCASDSMPDAIARIVERRASRVAEIATLSWDASAMMLAGADPRQGAMRMGSPEFLRRLSKMYRDTPQSLHGVRAS